MTSLLRELQKEMNCVSMLLTDETVFGKQTILFI